MSLKILVVNYKLRDDWTHEDLLARVNEKKLANSFRDFPGLLFKTFINNRDDNLYGGIYLFTNQKALDNYLISDLFKSVQNHPHFKNVTAQPFDIFSKPTRIMMDFFNSGAFKSIMQQDENNE